MIPDADGKLVKLDTNILLNMKIVISRYIPISLLLHHAPKKLENILVTTLGHVHLVGTRD